MTLLEAFKADGDLWSFSRVVAVVVAVVIAVDGTSSIAVKFFDNRFIEHIGRSIYLSVLKTSIHRRTKQTI